MKGQINPTASFLAVLSIAAVIVLLMFCFKDTKPYCKIQTWGKSELYCMKTYRTNFTNEFPHWEIRNRTQDTIDMQAAEAAYLRAKQEEIRQQACYAQGYDVSYVFDVLENYNLSCQKIAYINDHLITHPEQHDGGYIEGSYSGLISSGHLRGNLYSWVNQEVLATGQLVQNVSYHVDCEGKETEKIVDYYTENEFVMYYVDHCIQGHKA